MTSNISVKLGYTEDIMMAEVNLKEAYIKYLDILNSGREDDIKKAKYNLLF